MSSLKIIFQKSEVIVLGSDNEIASTYADIFHCQVGNFPITYLGVPVSPSRLRVHDWSKLGEKNAQKARCLARWLHLNWRKNNFD
uniref:Uncharacterized protein n=1 Tax=Arundo donax TaxID=35708 RepID=A0A0A9GMQ9_ARUDO